MTLARRAAALGLIAAPILGAQAQRDTLKAIPRELVEGLLTPFNMGFGGANEFVVGEVPESVKPFLFVPPSTRVIGSLNTSNSVYVVMTSTLSAGEITAGYRREQPKLGWTTPSSAGRTWGFVPAAAATQDNGGLLFCHINQTLEIRPYARPGVTQLTAVISNFGGPRCGATQPQVANTPTIMPLLENPMGVLMNAATCFQATLASPGPSSTTERVQTSLTPAQLLDGFAKQLGDSGWKLAETNGGMIRRVWTHPDSGNTIREVTLQATPSSTSNAIPPCTEVLLSVRRIASPR